VLHALHISSSLTWSVMKLIMLFEYLLPIQKIFV
jgi:hypothetical protein